MWCQSCERTRPIQSPEYDLHGMRGDVWWWSWRLPVDHVLSEFWFLVVALARPDIPAAIRCYGCVISQGLRIADKQVVNVER